MAAGRIALLMKKEGNTCYGRGEYSSAIRHYQSAIEIDPTIPALHYNLGLCFKKTGRLPEAKHCFEKALSLKPDYTKAKHNLDEVNRTINATPIPATAFMLGAAGASASSSPTMTEELPPHHGNVTLVTDRRPAALYLDGHKRPLAMVEAHFGKRLCNGVFINRRMLERYMDTARNVLPCVFLAEHAEMPPPLAPEKFNIIDMGPAGYGLAAQKHIKQGEFIGYYCGEIIDTEKTRAAEASAYYGDYAAEIGQHGTPGASISAIRPNRRDFTLMGLLQHLPRREDIAAGGAISCKDVPPEDIATENVVRRTVTLAFAEPEIAGASVIALIAIRDIKPGELLGEHYGIEYFLSRRTLPLLFTRQGDPIDEAAVTYDPRVLMRDAKITHDKDDLPLNVETRGLGEVTFGHCVKMASMMTTDPIPKAQKFIRRLLEADKGAAALKSTPDDATPCPTQ